MEAFDTGLVRRVVARATATAVLTTTLIVIPVGFAGDATGHAAEGHCAGLAVCVTGDDTKSSPDVWEDQATGLRIVLDKPTEKERRFTVAIGQADGNAGRINQFHQLDVKTEYIGANPFTITVPAGAAVSAPFSLKLLDDATAEADEWIDLGITEGVTAHGHFGVRVVDDDVVVKAVQIDAPSGAKLVEGSAGAVLTVTYPDVTLGDVVDVTLVPVHDVTSSRVIELERSVLRLAKGDKLDVRVRAVADGISQPATKVTVLAFVVPAGEPGSEPLALESTIAGRARPVTAQSDPMQSEDAPPPQPSVSIADATVDEFDGVVHLTITRTTNLAPALSIPVTYIDGSARREFDYPHPTDDLQTTAAVAAGASTGTLTVTLAEDSTFEGDETFEVRLGPLAGVTFTDATARVTITDVADTPTPQLVPGTPVDVGPDGGELPFHLTVPVPAAIPLSYHVATRDLEATAPEDYQSFAQQITIPAGATVSPTFHITVEPIPSTNRGTGQTERFEVVVSDAQGDDQDINQVRIVDPLEPPARFQRAPGAPTGPVPVTLAEGNSTTTHKLVLEKSQFVGAPPYPVTLVVNPLTADDALSARIRSAVSVSPSAIDFSPNRQSVDVFVTITGDAIDNSDMQFAVVVENARRLTIWGEPDDVALFTITDDDDPPPSTSTTVPVTTTTTTTTTTTSTIPTTTTTTTTPAATTTTTTTAPTTSTTTTTTVPPADSSADVVRGGIFDWFAGLGDWLPAFRLPEIEWPEPTDPEQAPFDLPTLPDLSDVFDLGGLFDGLAAPGFDVDADALEDAVADFAAVGCPVDFVAGGVGGAPVAGAGDIIQVHCTRTLAEIAAASGWTEGADGFPEGFADVFAAAGLTASIDTEWDADAIEFHVVAGVDVDGLYLLGSTGIRVRGVNGSGVVSGQGTVLGVPDVQLLGTAAAALDVTAALDADADTRVRSTTGELLPAEPVTRVAGAADVTLAASVEETHVDWAGHWETVPGSDSLTVATTQEITLTQDLPGFAVGTEAVPAVLTLRGVYGTCGGTPGWRLAGSFAPAAGEAFTFDGFSVDAVEATGCVNADGFTLDVTAGLVLGEGVSATTIDLELRLADGTWSGSGTVTRESLEVGQITLTDTELTFTVAPVGDSIGVTIGFTAAGATFGETELTGIAGTLRGTEQLVLHADLARAELADGALVFNLANVDLAIPGTNGVVFSTSPATATVRDLGVTATFTGLQIHSDGHFSASSAELAQPAGLLQSIGLGGLVPVDLTRVRLVFGTDLAEFEIHVDGTVDLSDFDGLPFTPVVQIGGHVITPASTSAQRAISFSVAVDSLNPLRISPLDLGPVTLGMHDLTVGPLTFDVDVAADGYVDGVLQPGFAATVAVTGGDWPVFEPGVTVTIENGQFVDGPNGPELSFDALVGFRAGDSGATVEDFTATLAVRFGFGIDGLPFVEVDLQGLGVGLLRVPFGPFAELSLTDAELILGPNGSFTIGGSLDQPGTGAQLVFLDAFPLLAGWGGRVGGVTFDANLVPTFTDGFFAELLVPEGELFGLPDFLPLHIDRVGIGLPDDIGPGDPLSDVLANLIISASGGLDGSAGFPVDADFDSLTVDIGKLLDYDPVTCGFDPLCFPVDLAGFRLAIDPELDLGGAQVSGELTFGRVPVLSECGSDEPTDVLYGRIRGSVRTPAFEAGADVVISEYGPVLLRVTAPAAVPLGPTGLVLQSVTGAAAFGDVAIPTPNPGKPEELLDPGALADLPTDADITEATLAARVGPSVAACQPTWNDGFAIALEGNLTHVAAAGMLGGRVVLGMNVRPDAGPQLFGLGEIEAFGVPLTEDLPPEFELGDVSGSVALGGILIDFARPLEPKIDMAFQSPAPGSPFELLVPTQVTVAAQLHTDGVLPGVIAGVEAGLATLDGAAREAILARTGGSTDVDVVIAAFAAYVETLTPQDAVALVEEFFAAIASAGEAALLAAGPSFNPSFVFRGALQPTVLGIPLGDPVNEVEIIMTRTSLGIGGTTSVVENMKRGLDLTTGGLAGPIITAASLGLTDRLTFTVQLPVPDMTAVLFGDGELQAFGTADPAWSGTLRGQFTQLGMTAQVTGFITSPGNTGFVDARVEKRWECSDGTTPVPTHCTNPPVPTLVQFSRESDYDNLLAHGGMVLDGRLQMPRLLTDPVDVLADATDEFPADDPLAMLSWFDQFGTTIGQIETPLRATFFVPLPGAVVDGDQTLEEWAAGMSMTGVFEGTRQTEDSDPVARLLSIPIGEGRMLATTQGIEITADVPLLGIEGTFAVRVEEVPFEGGTVTVPVGKLEAAMSSAELDAALTELGLPPVFSVSGVSGAAGFRAYTPGFDPDSPDRLQRVGGMAFTATLDAPGFVDDARAEIVVTGTDFTASAAVDQLGPFGPLTVTDAELTIRKLGATVTTHVAGSASLLGSDWSVAATLDSSLNGTFHLTGGGDLGGFAFDGTIDVTRIGANVAASVSGTLSIPGIGDLAANGSFDSAGNLDVTVGTPTGFRIGGASSPFFAVGQFRLATVNGAVTFRATNAGFEYRQSNGTVLFSAVVPTFAISSNGAFSVSTNAFTLGPSTGVHLEVPATTLSATANGLALKVRVPANAKLVIPDLADGTSGKPKINIPTALDIDTTNFEYTLVNATGTQSIDLGLMRLSGKLVFKRVNGGPFQLEIQGSTSTTPARVNLGDLGNVDFPNFRFATNGDFDVLATTTGLGPTNPRFRISGASIRLRNTGNATATSSDDFVELRIVGGELQLPSVAPIALPDLSLRVGDTFTRNITVPAIDLGPAFRTNQSSTFTLTIERARVRVELVTTANVTSTCGGASLSVRNGPTITALAGSSSMRLNSFLVDSDGAFTGSVTGCLQVFGNELAHGTFNVRLQNGVFELSLPSPGLNVNWGFGSVRVTGFARSDGTFDFSGTMSTDGSLPGVSWNGSATITATNQRLSGSFSGQVSLLGLSGSATGSVDSTGRVTGTLRVDLDGDGDTNGVPGFCVPVVGCTPTVPERAAFDFRIGGSLSPDTTAPTMATPSNITVTTSETGSTIPVYFAHPVASDNRDGSITATCSPGSGSQFTIGATRTVSCTARDSAGNSVSRSFTVTVSRASANVTVNTSTVIATVGGFAAGSMTLAALHSEPTAVASATADADGVARYEFNIPEDLPAGAHHIVAVGTAPDGAQRQWVVPIVLATGGEVVSVETNTGELPAGAARFVPMTPVRLFDTRPGEAAPGPKGRVGPESSIDVQVIGTAAGVPAEAVAVVMNVTVTDTGGPGYVTAYPTGGARPLASSINIAQAGQTRPNLVTVPIGDGGRVTLFSKGAAHLLADVAGYYLPADGPAAEGRFVPLTPQRLFDTRDAQDPLAAGESIDIGVVGHGLVPATGVAAVVLNLTATEAAAPGYVTAYPAGQGRPLASTVNLSSAGDTAPNLAIVPIGADGAITIFASHGAHVLGDVAGYITDASAAVDDAGLFVPLAPERVFDTRESEAAPGPKGFVPAGGQIDVAVAGVGSVPADAAGVVLNVTGVGSPGGFLTAWPTGPERPLASTLNFAAPVDTRANAAILPIGAGGHVSFYAKLGAHVLADAAGYFLG